MKHTAQRYEESALLAYALRDRRLASFYNDTRSKLGQIQWEIDPLLEEADGVCITYPNGQHTIKLRTVPAQEGPWIVAHELGHLVLRAAGYPTIVAVPPWDEIANYLQNVLEDLQIEDRLEPYGFDACKMYRNQAAHAYTAILSGVRFRTDLVGRMKLAIVFARLWLQHEYIRCRHPGPADARALNLLAAGHPSAAATGYQVVSFLHTHGFESPGAAVHVYRNALDLLGIADSVYILRDPRITPTNPTAIIQK